MKNFKFRSFDRQPTHSKRGEAGGDDLRGEQSLPRRQAGGGGAGGCGGGGHVSRVSRVTCNLSRVSRFACHDDDCIRVVMFRVERDDYRLPKTYAVRERFLFKNIFCIEREKYF